MSIAVLGVDGDGVSPRATELLTGAALVVGGARHLEALAPPGARRIALGGDLAPALDEIATDDGPVAVLASGDPGFFGIVRALAARVGPERLRIEPAPSSVATAFARVGVPWDDALVVSAHGRDPSTAVNAARAHPKVAILTAPDTPPDALAAHLDGLSRQLVVAERLGTAAERITTGTPREIAGGAFADPNVLLVLHPERLVAPAKARSFPPRTPTAWALPEAAFGHRDGMITKAEVRALALARLGPGIGDLVWDVGCGSGSVAIECARLGAAVIAIDRDADAVARTRANALAHGVSLEVVHAPAPQALAALPDPDAVFVGGGGPDAVRAAATRARRAVVVALATLERIGPTLEALSAAGLRTEATQLQASRLEPLGTAGHRLAAENPIVVATGSRPA